MLAAPIETNLPPTLNLASLELNPQKFAQICQDNPDIRMELTSRRELIFMSPTGWETGKTNSELNYQLMRWNKQAELGIVFDSSTGIILPNGAIYAPDLSWIQKSRLAGISAGGFLPIVPDFVVELRSASDSLSKLQAKMSEYIENGVRLGWLLNPQDREVEIYKIGCEKQVLKAPHRLIGEDVLMGFVMDLNEIW